MVFRKCWMLTEKKGKSLLCTVRVSSSISLLWSTTFPRKLSSNEKDLWVLGFTLQGLCGNEYGWPNSYDMIISLTLFL